MVNRHRFFPALSTVVISVLIVLLAAGCGRKGAPKPPEATAPGPVEYISARGAVDGIRFTWRPPSRTASGEDLIDLKSFVILRGDYDHDETSDFDELAEVPATGGVELVQKDAYNRQKTVQEYSYDDTSGLEPGKQYQYMIVAENEEGVRGRPGAVVRITFIGEASLIETLSK